ncbi:lipoprotein bor [Pasteurellaceae bacterium Macca]|nr:lipoprotein bor [Pasteurellaceae bacterium Macca]
MKKVITTMLLGLTLAISGCATQTATLKPTTKTLPTYENSENFFVFGIGQEKTINAVEICGGADKIAKVESFLSAPNILLTLVTIGIYSPRTSKVYCG